VAIKLNVADIYDKNLNFLIGSGASVGLLPTLGLKVRDAEGRSQTIETLATIFAGDEKRLTALFAYYYQACIYPAQVLSIEQVKGEAEKEIAFQNYRSFLENVLSMLQKRKASDRRCNIFTTNYDGCIPLSADAIMKDGSFNFVLNDGTHGFLQRIVEVRNFLRFVMQTGVFERHQVSIPQVNLVHLHGSVYWKKSDGNISVNYLPRTLPGLVTEEMAASIADFSAALHNDQMTVDDLPVPEFPDGAAQAFWEEFKKLPVVNPTKWKFYETVFDEHYYQMLRMLSYELEKPSSVLITFGFSFADEHILSLIKRSLTNPTLQVFVCCFDHAECERLKPQFQIYRNVAFIESEVGVLDFSVFNSVVINIPTDEPLALQPAVISPVGAQA
jgi:hypothetical protein